MSKCIVVARYNEDVSWTKQFPNVLIYNKGTELNNGYNEFFLNNVGREGHTYYKYICDNYDNLSDYTIFLQGRPFDHSPNIISNIYKYIDNQELNIDFEFLSEWIIDSSLNDERSRYQHCINIHKTWEYVFGETIDDKQIIFGAGAQFIVSKNKILKHTKEFYENIVNILGYTVDPFEGYDVERFHREIFM
jgi:hypothetical protein